jgi:hypothetical protein
MAAGVSAVRDERSVMLQLSLPLEANDNENNPSLAAKRAYDHATETLKGLLDHCTWSAPAPSGFPRGSPPHTEAHKRAWAGVMEMLAPETLALIAKRQEAHRAGLL